uniref:meprin A subunit alpha-like n=1 Tax=Styela clava TaxID=7725 RepID=UPI00193AAF84|nr:meprin A subunit alpha-like [Styela clava]
MLSSIVLGMYAVLFQGCLSDSQKSDGLDTNTDITSINRDLDNLFEGDILLSPSSRNSQNEPSLLWTNGIVPMAYGSSASLGAIAAMEDARIEFALNTCINVKIRELEMDFITVESSNGCWSRVGKVGGNQTVSMGPGCQYKGTAIHEILHAIGFYHEQSRKDRDDYITIEWSNVIADKSFNFDKMIHLDNLREPYDLDSLVHYEDVAFSKDGSSKTMRTNDMQLQDKLSIRKHTFSETDVRKVNRLYNCGDTLLYSYHCDFSERTICGWVLQNSTWSWIDLSAPGFPVGQLIPIMDGTHAKHFTGAYIYTTSNSTEVIKSMMLRSKSTKQCLQFWYYLEHSAEAEINISIASVDDKNGEVTGIWNQEIFITRSGNQWKFMRRTISAPPQYRILIQSKLSGKSALAIDDFSVMDRRCDTTYFVYPSFTSRLTNSAMGDGIVSSPVLTDDGYAFHILVYVKGSNLVEKDKITVFFKLAPSPSDDQLEWPYKNRYVRLSVIDQQSNPLRAQDQTRAFIDKERENAFTVSFGGTIVTTDGLLGRRHFVKHDTLIISVDVRDMTPFISQSSPGTTPATTKPTTVVTRVTKQTPEVTQTDTESVTTIKTTEQPAPSTPRILNFEPQTIQTTAVTTSTSFTNSETTPSPITQSPTTTTSTYVSTIVTTSCTLFSFKNLEIIMLMVLAIVTLLLLVILIITCMALRKSRADDDEHRTKSAIQSGLASGVPKVEVLSVREKEDKIRERASHEVYLNNEYTQMMSIHSEKTPEKRGTTSKTDNRSMDTFLQSSSQANVSLSEINELHTPSRSRLILRKSSPATEKNLNVL